MCIFFICGRFHIANAEVAKSDEMNFFLELYEDGKSTGNFIHFDLVVYQSNKQVKWLLTQEWFQNDDYEKCTHVMVTQCRSESDYSYELISRLSWEPGKKINFKYAYSGDRVIKIKIVKDPKNKQGWKFYGAGNDSIPTSKGKPVMIELRSVENIILKNPKLENERGSGTPPMSNSPFAE